MTRVMMILDRAVALRILREYATDDKLGPAANTALDCVTAFGADPRMLVAVIEAAAHGFDWRTASERNRQRYAQKPVR